VRFRLLLVGCWCWFLCWGVAIASFPHGYYAPLNGKSAEDLKTALSELLLQHTVLDYYSLWDCFLETDIRADGSIWDMYSATQRFDTWEMNREHVFPKSWWGGDVNAAYTDLNHIFPADEAANLAKNNYPLGRVGAILFDNGVSKVGYNTFEGYSFDKPVFEPDDAYKGDFARSFFYVVTCYQNYQWKYTYMVDSTTYPTLKPWAIALLLAWHRFDPVSDKEQCRNEAVFTLQHNRNPFIDCPVLAEHIWGDAIHQPFTLKTEEDPLLSTPVNGAKLDLGISLLGGEQTRLLYIKGNALTDSLSIFLEQTGEQQPFTLACSRLGADEVATGYPLSVTFHPTQTGSCSGSLVLFDSNGSVYVKVSLTAFSLSLDSLLPPTVLPPKEQPVSSEGGFEFTARWMPTRFAACYALDVYRVEAGCTQLVQTIDSLLETSFTVTGLDMGTLYAYTVRSCLQGMSSSPSAEMPVAFLSWASGTNPHVIVYASTGSLLIQASEPGLTIELVAVSGLRLERFVSTGHLQRIDGLPKGLYLVRCNGFTLKVMVSK